jgi:hypothetical protein
MTALPDLVELKPFYQQKWADRYFGSLFRCLLPSGLPK